MKRVSEGVEGGIFGVEAKYLPGLELLDLRSRVQELNPKALPNALLAEGLYVIEGAEGNVSKLGGNKREEE